MNKEYIIRNERKEDYREVENLTREAFWNVYRPGGQEHFVLNQFRSNPDFIPELDLVMELDGRIIGHVMFSKASITLAGKMKIHYHGEPPTAEVPYFLAQELIPGYWGDREGTYCPPAGYFVAEAQPEAFEAYEAGFPHKEKLRLPGQLTIDE